jgi:hypothetical protein
LCATSRASCGSKASTYSRKVKQVNCVVKIHL